ncbi:hypothetical protein [Pelosinus sp. UFO1]|uniref:hypothetical protein n=1 Tax=Pelosinus sp. UFO1 TaxID=484770 RepID=UPI0004D0B604|nr:hypothetical protein [Pelosinus sp. UFO1]AIF51268.1 hypothetical protein UFO1_1717 [Pelosinus sp. UFO1]
MYYLHYDESTGFIVAPYHSAVHGKEIPLYNAEPLVTKVAEVDENGNTVVDKDGNQVMKEIIQDPGTVQIGTTLDLSAIPTPYIEITDSEHDDWMQNQSTRKIDIDTKKLVEYTPPAPSVEVIRQNKLSALDAEYQPQFAELSQALGMAMLSENTDLITSIKADYAELKTEYDTKRGEIDD